MLQHTNSRLQEYVTKINSLLPVVWRKQHLLKGFGFHLVSVTEVANRIKHDDLWLSSYLTKEEIFYCNNRMQSLAGRIAAKIAVRKAMRLQSPYPHITISHTAFRQPFLDTDLNGGFGNSAISITHDRDVAAALGICFEKSTISKKQHTMQTGLDLTYYHRIARFVTLLKREAMHHILTPREYAQTNGDIQKIADIWAGKEAVSKALGTGIGHGSDFHTIEILTQNGVPKVLLSGHALHNALQKNLTHWQISHIRFSQATFAFVIANSV